MIIISEKGLSWSNGAAISGATFTNSVTFTPYGWGNFNSLIYNPVGPGLIFSPGGL